MSALSTSSRHGRATVGWGSHPWRAPVGRGCHSSSAVRCLTFACDFQSATTSCSSSSTPGSWTKIFMMAALAWGWCFQELQIVRNSPRAVCSLQSLSFQNACSDPPTAERVARPIRMDRIPTKPGCIRRQRTRLASRPSTPRGGLYDAHSPTLPAWTGPAYCLCPTCFSSSPS